MSNISRTRMFDSTSGDRGNCGTGVVLCDAIGQ